MSIILGYEAKIRAGTFSLATLATEESDCSSARKRGDLYTPPLTHAHLGVVLTYICTSTAGILEGVICRRSLRMLPSRWGLVK